MKVNETYDWVWEYGVRYANGKVSMWGEGAHGKVRAQGGVEAINQKAREIGAPQTARLVRRKMKRTVQRSRWEAA